MFHFINRSRPENAALPWRRLAKSLIRPHLIILAFVAGFFCPEAEKFSCLIKPLLILMFYFICLQMQVKELRLYPGQLKLLGFNLVFPTLLWLIFCAFGQPVVGQVAFFTAIAPTANAAPVITKFLGGKFNYVVNAFVLTNLGVAVASLFLLPLVTEKLSIPAFVEVAKNMAVVILLPILLAVLTRLAVKSAPKIAAKSSGFSFLLWLMVLFVIASKVAAFLQSNQNNSRSLLYASAILSALICICNFSVGRWLGKPDYAAEASQSLGQKNTSLSIFLALEFASPLIAAGASFYIIYHNLWNAVQMFRHDLREGKKNP